MSRQLNDESKAILGSWKSWLLSIKASFILDCYDKVQHPNTLTLKVDGYPHRYMVDLPIPITKDLIQEITDWIFGIEKRESRLIRRLSKYFKTIKEVKRKC